jgi:hypothetical protein
MFIIGDCDQNLEEIYICISTLLFISFPARSKTKLGAFTIWSTDYLLLFLSLLNSSKEKENQRLNSPYEQKTEIDDSK